MNFFRTTASFIALGFALQATQVIASKAEDDTTEAHFTSVVQDNMDLLGPLFEEMKNNAPPADDHTEAYFTKVVHDNMGLLAPLFDGMKLIDETKLNAPEEMVIFGSYKKKNPRTEWAPGIQEVGKIAVSEDNRGLFLNIPDTGAVIELTEENKVLYDKVVYTHDTLRLRLGKTFGIVPKFKGENVDAVMDRMKFPTQLGYLNIE